MMEGLDGMLLACRASILLDRREAGEPTGIEETAIIEEDALAAAYRIMAFLGRMADPDGDEFARGLGWKSARLLKFYLDHGHPDAAT